MSDTSDATSPLRIAITLIAALALTILPLPEALQTYRPEWLALAACYWCLNAPWRFGLGTAFVSGLAMDTLTGAFLGQHALALVVLAFLMLTLRRRLRVFPLGQQTLSVTLIVGVYELVLLWVDGMAGQPLGGIWRWMPVLTTLLLWPAITLTIHWRRLRDLA